MKKSHVKSALTVALAGTLFAGTLAAETLRYAGSDFLAGETESALVAAVKAATPEIEMNGELIGSRTALDDLRAGKIDFALMLQNADEIPEINSGLWNKQVFAYHVAYLVVPQANPIEELSLFQLRGIFAENAERPITAWNEISATGTRSTKIERIVSTQNGDLASTAFQSLAFPRTHFSAGLRKMKTDHDALHALENAKDGIALVSTAPIRYDALKTVAISPVNENGKTGTAYPPIPSNIYNRDYPLSLQFFIAYPKKNAAKVAPVIRTALSDSFAEKLSESNLMPLPKSIRKNLQKEVDEEEK